MNIGPILPLSRGVRRFRKAHGLFLSWDRDEVGNGIATGSTINVSEPVMRCYDHRVKVAVPIDFVNNDKGAGEFFVLFEELSAEDQLRMRQLFPENPLISRAH